MNRLSQILIRNPEVIQRVQNSSEALASALESFIKTESNVQVIDHFLRHVIIKDGLGIDDATEQEIDKIKAWEKSGKTAEQLAYLFGDMVSRRALIGVSI